MKLKQINPMNFLRSLFLVLCFASAGVLQSQTPPPPPGSNNPAPLGGIALLAAAGAAYGGKKAYDRHRK